jgi:hypothetical protein
MAIKIVSFGSDNTTGKTEVTVQLLERTGNLTRVKDTYTLLVDGIFLSINQAFLEVLYDKLREYGIEPFPEKL